MSVLISSVFNRLGAIPSPQIAALTAWGAFALVAGAAGAVLAVAGLTWGPFYGFQAGGLWCLGLMLEDRR